jgi:hypothetical protein
MKAFKVPCMAFIIAVSCCSLFAQINFGHFSAQAMREGKWTSADVDSVLIETNVCNGIATTVVTMSVKPEGYQICTYVLQPSSSKDTVSGSTTSSTYSLVCLDKEQLLDSVEINCSFTLPTDFVAKNLYLWVNGTKQTASIQDKALAAQQYTQIVGKRKDPALLEFYGNGYYNLRIFPTKSYMSRKVAIEFQHTMDDDSLNLITGRIPVAFDSSSYYWYSTTVPKKYVGYVQVQCTATDFRKYSFGMEGLGEGTFSIGQPLMLQKSSVVKLGGAVFATANTSPQNKFFWGGIDKDKNVITGFSTVLAESTVVRDPEPATRVIVMDVGSETWDWNEYYKKYYEYSNPGYTYPSYNYPIMNTLQRAQKFAVLCLQNYVATNQKFNLILTTQGAKSPAPVFDSPVSPTTENLNKAYLAIVSASASPSTTLIGLKKAIGQSANGVLILISDLYQPYNYGTYVNNQWTVSADGNAYDLLHDSISQLVKASNGTFFTISDDGRLSQIAYTCGGFQLASLRYDYYYRYVTYRAPDGQQKNAPQLPALFGTYNSGISNLQVFVADNSLSQCVFSTNSYNYYYYGVLTTTGPILMASAMLDKKQSLAKTAVSIAPYYYNRNIAVFRFAGVVTSPLTTSAIECIVSGKMGGIGFTKKISGSIASLSGMSSAGEDNVEWAFTKSEQLAGLNWSGYADSIKALGLAYHIVTRQTSLLALEPGTELWKDTTMMTATSNGQNGEKVASVTSQDAMIAAPGTAGGNNLNDVSLDDLIKGSSGILGGNGVAAVSKVSAVVVKGGLRISLPLALRGGAVQLSMYTLQGRMIVSKTLSTAEAGNAPFVWNFGNTARMTKGYYILKVKTALMEKTISLPWME